MSSLASSIIRYEPTQQACHDRPVHWFWSAGSRGALGAAAVATTVILAAASGNFGTGGNGPPLVAPELVLDPNTAPAQVLTALPTVGPALVRRMIAAREERPFDSLEDARRRVRGLGPAGLARIAPHLRLKAVTELGKRMLAATSGSRPPKKPRTSRSKTIVKRGIATRPPATQLAARDAERDGS
jgi:competence protein ComEA